MRQLWFMNLQQVTYHQMKLDKFLISAVLDELHTLPAIHGRGKYLAYSSSDRIQCTL